MTGFSEASRDGFHRALGRLFESGSAVSLSEAELLERFSSRGDESAFEVLVERHGPMVLGVCRRHLRDPNDVDDAFQAVFLVLFRKAGSLRRKELLGAWLHGVARKVAVRARSLAAVREARVGSTADGEALGVDARRSPSLDPAEALARDEGNARLHEEVERLPWRYRAPVVACYFEGKTHEEAAELLGCPLGTVKGRLARARDLLRKRLERRGFADSPAAMAGRLASPELRPPVPPALVSSTIQSALMTAESLPISIQVLVEGALKAMILAQAKAVALPLSLVAVGLLAIGGSVAAYQGDELKTEPQEKPPAQAKPEKKADADRSESEKPEDIRGIMGRMGDMSGDMMIGVGMTPGSGMMGPGMMPGMGMMGGEMTTRKGRIRMDRETIATHRQDIARLSATVAKFDENPETKAVLEALDKPFTLRMTENSTLGDLLKQIKESLATSDGRKVPVYIDPQGIEEAGAALNSPVAIDLQDVPLRLSLRLALKQLNLAYCVREGVVIISSLDGILQELKEAESELIGLHPDKVIIGPGGASFMGSPGGMM